MIPHKKYLQPLRKTIAQLAISTSTIAVVLGCIIPFNKALAIPDVTTLRVDGYFDDIVPLSFLDPGNSTPDAIKYFFTFDATGNSKTFSTFLLQPGLTEETAGFDELDDFIFSLTSWGIDFGQNGKIEGNKNEIFSNKFGVPDTNLSLQADSFGSYLKLNNFSANGFNWDLQFDIGLNGFSTTKFKWTAVNNSSTFVIARDFNSATKSIRNISEPASTLALLALGGLGVASKLRKSNK